MWEPRPLTSLWAFTACYRHRYTFFFYLLTLMEHMNVLHVDWKLSVLKLEVPLRNCWTCENTRYFKATFRRYCIWRMPSSGIWRRLDLVNWTDFSEERVASIFRVEKSASDESAWVGGNSHFVHHKSHRTWSGLELGPPRWEAGD
jgi:hypothetical protein